MPSHRLPSQHLAFVKHPQPSSANSLTLRKVTMREQYQDPGPQGSEQEREDPVHDGPAPFISTRQPLTPSTMREALTFMRRRSIMEVSTEVLVLLIVPQLQCVISYTLRVAAFQIGKYLIIKVFTEGQSLLPVNGDGVTSPSRVPMRVTTSGTVVWNGQGAAAFKSSSTPCAIRRLCRMQVHDTCVILHPKVRQLQRPRKDGTDRSVY
ncbi:hypothetical protein BJV78DRAFT_1157528, partial [Lactifluus subvellereus]